MPEFNYLAMDRQGKRVEGTISAENSALALGRLRAMGLEVEKVRLSAGTGSSHTEKTVRLTPQKEGTGSMSHGVMETFAYPVVSGVSLAVMAQFYRQLAALINAGMPIYQALSTQFGQTHNSRLAKVINEMMRTVVNGGRISDVMERHPSVFPDVQLEMVRAAEQGGMLEIILSRIADYLEQEIQLRQLISRLTLYPKIVALVAVMILGKSVLFGGGMPAISAWALTGNTLNYLNNTVFFLAEIGIAAFFIFAFFRIVIFRSEAAKELYERIKYSIPGVGDVARKVALARFGRAFGALYGAGVGLNAAIRAAGAASGSRIVHRASMAGVEAANRGELLSETFRQTGVFNIVVIDMLRTGEYTGNIDQMMTKVAEYLEGEAETKANKIAHIFSIVLYLIVALLVAQSIIGFYSGYSKSIMSGTN
jgi:type II secretory pathway component PulF